MYTIFKYFTSRAIDTALYTLFPPPSQNNFLYSWIWGASVDTNAPTRRFYRNALLKGVDLIWNSGILNYTSVEAQEEIVQKIVEEAEEDGQFLDHVKVRSVLDSINIGVKETQILSESMRTTHTSEDLARSIIVPEMGESDEEELDEEEIEIRIEELRMLLKARQQSSEQ
eukprot:TRINITY_DN9993_c0_g1_i1.p1 TRINITY_DN9993_c0_g1~~TRINITY_DN9993_c0_g1_i1.p1  ORF type:complete len:181 (-),score=38.75 TRINITY_DN9993_c0_g1_i1:54-563(-)